jgi:hypothetical protein
VPSFAHRVGQFSDEAVKRLEAMRDEIAISARSISADDEKFARVETSLDRALERAVKGFTGRSSISPSVD